MKNKRVIALLAFAISAIVISRAHAQSVALMPMGPHMDMTQKRPMQPGDQARADEILNALAPLMTKYADVAVAQADGYVEYLPQLHLPQAHFTNWAYAKEAWQGHFDPAHPTSLMYRRTGKGWTLEGAMYTAPPTATQAQLDRDVPMSIGSWHRHVNLCSPPAGSPLRDSFGPGARFGLGGSIHDQTACTLAGGTWTAQLYGWMLHVWPMEKTPEKIWALHPDGDDQMGGAAAQMRMRMRMR